MNKLLSDILTAVGHVADGKGHVRGRFRSRHRYCLFVNPYHPSQYRIRLIPYDKRRPQQEWSLYSERQVLDVIMGRNLDGTAFAAGDFPDDNPPS